MTVKSFLHSLPHINHNFKHVSHKFKIPNSYQDIWKWNTNEYQESIQMFMILLSLVGLIYILLSIIYFIIKGIFNICCKCCNKSKPRSSISRSNSKNKNVSINFQTKYVSESPPSSNLHMIKDDFMTPQGTPNLKPFPEYKRWVKCSRLLLILLTLCSIGHSIYQSIQLYNKVKDVQDDWDDSYKPYKQYKDTGKSIRNDIMICMNDCTMISHANPSSNISNLVYTINNSLSIANQDINEYLDTAQSVPKWGSTNQLNTPLDIIFYFVLSTLCCVVSMLLFSLFTRSKSSQSRACNICNIVLQIFIAILLLMTYVLICIQFGFSIEVSDACNNPENAVLQAVNNSNGVSGDAYNTAEFYIYCDTKHDNPLYYDINQSYYGLLDLNASIYELNSLANTDPDIVPYVTNLTDEYQDSLNLTRSLTNELQDCKSIHHYWKRIKDDLCKDGVEDWFLLYLGQFFVVLFLVIRSCFVCSSNKNNGKYIQIVDDNENEKSSLGKKSIENTQLSLQNYSEFSSSKKYVPPDDEKVKRILRYLSKIEERMERTNEADQLKRVGFPQENIPCNPSDVDKALAILRNKERNPTGRFQHPLLEQL